MDTEFNCVPAGPDFYIVTRVSEPGEKVKFDLNPIIAWSIEREAGVICRTTPITVEGQSSGAIVYPDGSVCVPWVDRYESIEAWLGVEEVVEKDLSSV